MRRAVTLLLSGFLMAGTLFAGTTVSYAAKEQSTDAVLAEIVPVDTVLRQAPVETEGVETEVESESETETEWNILDHIVAALDGIAIPEGAEQITYNLNGAVVQAAETETGLILLPIEMTDGTIRWYIYNEATAETIPYARFTNLNSTFVILPLDEGVSIPKEWESVKISLEGAEMPAWRNPLLHDVNMYFVYATDENGNKGIYRFDGPSGFLMRYVEDMTEAEPTEPPTDNPELLNQISEYQSRAAVDASRYNALNDEHETGMLYRSLIIIGLAAFCLILLLIVAVLSGKLKRRNRELEAYEEAEAEMEPLEEKMPKRRRARAEYEYEDEQEEEYIPVRRRRKPSYDETYEEQREGVSKVRRARRAAEFEDEVDFSGNRAVSGRKRVAEYEEEELPRRRERVSYQEERRVERRKAEPVMDEEFEAYDDMPKKAENVRRAPRRDASARREAERRMNTEDVYEEEEEIFQNAPANVTQSVKIATKNASLHEEVEDLFDDDDDAEFEVNDFKNV